MDDLKEKLIKMISEQPEPERVDKIIVSTLAEQVFEWEKWRHEIPYLSFPSHWQVKIVPPFFGAVIRFRIKTDTIKDEDSLSVYLDCYDLLGFVNQPYWEVYPVDGRTERFKMQDTQGLLDAISRGLKEGVKHEDTKKDGS